MGMMKLLIFMILAFCISQEASAQALSGCQSKCGNVVIPYPFGIGANCSASSNFTITCNNTYTPPKPLLGNNISNEVVQITISDSESTIRITNPSKQDERPPQFLFADNQTRSTTVLDWSSYWSCNSDTSGRSLATCGENAVCSWNGYCGCQSGYEGNPYTPNGCQDINECSKNDLFYNETSGGWYYNRTADSYNETSYYQGYTYCSMGCNNHPGTYSCYCFSGYVLASDGRSCNPDNKRTTIIIGVSSAVGVLILLAVLFGLYKLLKRRIEKKRKEMFFKKNGGLLLQKQISSSGDASVENSKLFSKKELEMATDYYNENRILGQGGQGTVYKGMLTDGRIVAVKKSKIEHESELEPFINEVVILSKIDQRNIVKLHGYCLETEVPLLVYEFIPNGTLYKYIHEENEDFPLSWDVRVRVAKEIAGALSYLHSSASIPIYHRDIKSTNILLDEKFRAKVADFGTSRSVEVDQTHLTTRVQGTFGYFDPEYFQSSQFTDKSDVYSFGVVLVELLTGQKPILSHRSDDEERSLATFFILAMEQDRLFDIVDPRVINEGKREEMLVFAKLAHRCLHLNGRKRPTMRQVATELEVITLSMTETSADEHYDEVEYSAAELIGPWEITSSSVESGTVNSTLLHHTY